MEFKGLKINFLGDSITQGHGVENSAENRFTALLEKEYGIIARNYGLSGTRIANSKEFKYGPSFNERYSDMDDDADMVFVFGGTNDYGHSMSPIGTPDDRMPDTFYGACHSLFMGLIEKYPDSVIVIMTPIHRCGESNPNGLGGILKTYVDIIKSVAEQYSLPVLDLWKTSGLQPAVKVIQEKFIPDGLHPNADGHKILASRIAGFIKTH